MTNGFYDRAVEQQTLALSELAAKALESYDGTFSSLQLVKYRENAVFSVRRDCGSRLALRIHRHGYHSNEALASELSWMRALADAGIAVPGVLSARDGNTLTFASIPAVPEQRQIDLLHWLDGRPLSALEAQGALSRDERRAIYRGIGELAARLHNHSSDWSPPPGFVRHNWFAEALLGDRPLWGRFWELEKLTGAQAELLQAARRVAFRDLAEYGMSPENVGLIHADLLADNLLVNGSVLQPIDFDDSGFGWHMFELATVLYFLSADPDYPALRRAVLDGYRSARPLSERDEAALPLFLVVRSMTYLGWIHTRSETATAREQAPMLIESCCTLCEDYIRNSSV
jgi:Ser/Thr protein kinase RdoA (MazF antagonist)